MEFEKVIRERTATRKFSNKLVEKDIIDKILEAGRIAPTAKNLQPIKIYVVQSEEGLKKLKSILDTWTPGSEFISREKNAERVKEGRETFLKFVKDKFEAESK